MHIDQQIHVILHHRGLALLHNAMTTKGSNRTKELAAHVKANQRPAHIEHGKSIERHSVSASQIIQGWAEALFTTQVQEAASAPPKQCQKHLLVVILLLHTLIFMCHVPTVSSCHAGSIPR